MGLRNGRCDRCDKPVTSLRMSMFNTDMCCVACITKEKAHPLYGKAKEAEYQATKNGDYNFPGIGKPEDL